MLLIIITRCESVPIPGVGLTARRLRARESELPPIISTSSFANQRSLTFHSALCEKQYRTKRSASRRFARNRSRFSEKKSFSQKNRTPITINSFGKTNILYSPVGCELAVYCARSAENRETTPSHRHSLPVLRISSSVEFLRV